MMPRQTLQVVEEKGNLFDRSANVIIVQACNCKGSWDAGIAREFKTRYPDAYDCYHSMCKKNGYKLLGKSEMIFQTIVPLTAPIVSVSELQNEEIKYFIGCLFTSYSFGKYKDRESSILKSTESAMKHLLERITEWNREAKDIHKIEGLNICKINSGLFNIPWEETKKVLESIDVSESTLKVVKVISIS